MRFLMMLCLCLGTFPAFAVENLDCDSSQAGHPACALAIPDGNRCGESQAMQFNCRNDTVGCDVLGGCFGATAPGLWYTYSIDGRTFRCKCGCFAEETRFATAAGEVRGTELIERGAQPLQALVSLDGASWDERVINDVIWGPEKEASFRITTAGGRRVVLSGKHPVLVGEPESVAGEGSVRQFKTADQIRVGDELIGSDGRVDPVAAVEKVNYGGRMVNFNVASERAVEHVVDANGLKLGDNAWQQRLAATEARLLDRAAILMELSRP